MSRGLTVMGKLPLLGRVKTRLAQRLGPAVATELYRAFLLDVFEIVRAAQQEASAQGLGFRALFACDVEGGTLEDARRLAPPGWDAVAQPRAELGVRILAARAAIGTDVAVVIGSDAPTMPPGRIVEALAILERDPQVGAVVGPTVDGGYDLIALRGSAPAMFSDIPWSTPEVLAATRAAAGRAGVDLVELAFGQDIDEWSDLEPALAAVQRPGSLAHHTRTALVSLFAAQRQDR